MKKILIINTILSLFIITSCTNINSQNDLKELQSDLQKMKLNGKVKTIQTSIYEAVAVNNRIVKGRLIGDRSQLNNIKLFNDFGNISEGKFYFTDGDLAHTEKFKYDSTNKLIEKNKIYPKERFNEKTIYKFNNVGKLIEKSTFEFDNSLNAREEFKYDSNNTLIEHRFYLSKLREITEYISANQTITQAYVYDMDEGKILKSVRIYDDNENVIEEKINNDDGSIKFKYILKYDNQSRLFARKAFDSEMNLMEKITYKYYSDSKLKEYCVYNSDNKAIEKQEREFDKHGNIISLTFFNLKDNIERRRIYEYKFDENMNWIQKIEILNDTPTEFMERIIKYDID